MELNIYFKNVGQGDTILLDWRSSKTGKQQYALIDCNLYRNDIGPVIKHIENHGIKEFNFVLLTHPHCDHFSGFLKFFDYCENNNVVVRRFLHTAVFNPDMLRATLQEEEISGSDFKTFVLSGVNFRSHKEKLLKIFCRTIQEAEKNGTGFIKFVHAVNNMPFIMSPGIQGQFLAPGLMEMQEYIRENFIFNAAPLANLQQDTENNPHANILSSVFRIYSEEENWQVLLCSDCTRDTLRQIIRNEELRNTVCNSKLLAMQIPHHGSENNHAEEFWHEMKEKEETHAIVSVGLGYGHPAKSVIEYFKGNYHCVQATNFVGGYRDVFLADQPNDITPYLSLLDLSAIKIGATSGCDAPLERTGGSVPEKHLKVVIGEDNVLCSVFPGENGHK